MSLPSFLRALQMLRILELSAAGGDAKARAFVPLFADWLARSVQAQELRSTPAGR